MQNSSDNKDQDPKTPHCKLGITQSIRPSAFDIVVPLLKILIDTEQL